MSPGGIVDLRVNDALWILDPIAHCVRHRFQVVELNELVSVGYIALRTKSENFDSTLGVPFSSYAWMGVMGAMLDVVRKEFVFANRMHHAGIQAVTLLTDTGDLMRDDETQHRATAQEFLSAVAAAMRAQVLSSHTASRVTGNTEEQLDWADALKALHVAFEQLPPQQARLIEQHYMQSMTLRSIAERSEVSYSTAKRRHNDALRALAEALRRERRRR